MKFQTEKRTKGPKLNLKLEKDDDSVNLIATDEECIKQTLLTLRANGRLLLVGYISESFGLELDDQGCLVLEN